MIETETKEDPSLEILPQNPTWERDEQGLLKHIKYARNPDGGIDWRAMVSPEFLVPNKQNFQKRNTPVPVSIEGVDDKDLLILLGGIKRLAALRGYTKVNHEVTFARDNAVGVKTTIHWIGNYETGGVAVEFTELADANYLNTSDFAKGYLSAIAANRGFVRAVRNFLGVNVVGSDEVGAVAESTSSSGDEKSMLSEILTKNGISFEAFKNRMIEATIEGAQDWKSLNDVKGAVVYECLTLVTKRITERKKAKA